MFTGEYSGELTGVCKLPSTPRQNNVVAPIAGSLRESRIRPRDRILQIDGISTAKLTLDEAAARMRGPIGSHVSLVVERGEDSTEIQLVRSRIALNPVVAELRSDQEAKPATFALVNSTLTPQ